MNKRFRVCSLSLNQPFISPSCLQDWLPEGHLRPALRILGTALVCLMLLCLAGCFPAVSINPWYTNADVVQDSRIVGTWVGEASNDPGAFTITQTEGRAYTLTASDKASPDITESLAIHLFRLDGQLYLDAVEDHIYYKNEELSYGSFRIPAHMVGKVMIDKDAMTLQFLDDTWLANSIKSGAAPLVHIGDAKENMVVTAGAPELQTILKKNSRDQKAFAVEMKLHRGH